MKRTISSIGIILSLVLAVYILLTYSNLPAKAADPNGTAASPNDVLPITPVSVTIAAGDQVHPAVAYNTEGDEFMVIWADARNGVTWDIHGQRLLYTGQPREDPFVVGAGPPITDTQDAPHPRIAWNSTDNEFLVAWKSPKAGSVIYGQRLRPWGEKIGGRLHLSPTGFDTAYNQWKIDLTYNPDDNQHLLVWADVRYGPAIYMQRLSNTGTRIGGEAPVCPGCGISQRNPAVVYNKTVKEYFVVWQELIDATVDVFGQRVSRTGTLLTTGIEIVRANGTQSLPDVTHNVSTNEFVTIWRDGRDDANRPPVWGRTISASGAPVAAPMTMTTYLADQRHPAVEWHAGDSAGYLVLWADTRDYGETKAAENADLMARWLNAAGAPLGTDLMVSQGYGVDFPDLDYSEKWKRYMIVWQDGRNDSDGQYPWEYDIFAARVKTGAPPLPTSTPMATPTATTVPTDTPTVTPTAAHQRYVPLLLK